MVFLNFRSMRKESTRNSIERLQVKVFVDISGPGVFMLVPSRDLDPMQCRSSFILHTYNHITNLRGKK